MREVNNACNETRITMIHARSE